ncbi:unnamed protein product [marine sediment metagenome]|uniref:Uncharacterized protein n=1 Tax=marine sediment metagenome TaxID=412755 RepID=X1LMW9_9ZZZZ
MRNVVTIVAIISIAIVEICALASGIDGSLLALSFGAMAGLGGTAVVWKKLHH